MAAHVTSICHIPYRVRDIDETVAFFTEMFGFRLLRRWQAADGWGGAYLEMGNVLLEVNKVADEAELPKPGGLQPSRVRGPPRSRAGLRRFFESLCPRVGIQFGAPDETETVSNPPAKLAEHTDLFAL